MLSVLKANPPAPLVSVVMAVHNRERYVGRAVDSILGQSFGDFELIAVDDGSTDSSPGILAAFAARDVRVRVRRQDNAGVSSARNAGIALARGEFVAVMDDDDVALPTRLEKQVAFLQTHAQFASVSCQCETMDEDGRFIKTTKVHKELQEPGAPLSVLVRGVVAVNQTTMFRAGALRDVGGYRSFFVIGEDYDLALRLAEKFGAACLSGEVLHRHRQHSPHTGVNLMSSHLLAPFNCAAIFSAYCRHNGMEDPIDNATAPWEVVPLAAVALPPDIKAICIKNASTDARKLMRQPALSYAGDLEVLLQYMDTLATGRSETLIRSRVLRKILFYALQRGRFWDAARIVRELVWPLQPPELA